MSAHETRAHSELGASICSRWWNCPGSVQLSRGMPNPSSPHSRRGTAAHEVGESCLRESWEAAEYVGRVVVVDGEAIEFTPDMAEDVQVYVETCRDLLAEPGVEHWQEVRFDLSRLDPPSPMFGTADFVAYSPLSKTAWIIDYKNGYLHVSEETPQLKYYAIGAAMWLGKEHPIRNISVAIVQPNGTGEPVRWREYTVAELAEWAKEMLVRARATQEPDAPLNAGHWCRFCPARTVCPQRAEQALAVAELEFQDVLVSPRVTPTEIRLITPDELGVLLSKADLLDKWLKDLREAALAELAAGRDVPGWKLVAKRPARSVSNEEGFVGALEDSGVSPYREPELLSPAQAEAALEPHMPGKTKKARLEAAKAALAPSVQSVSSGATLASEADPRPALPASGDEFQNLLQ